MAIAIVLCASALTWSSRAQAARIVRNVSATRIFRTYAGLSLSHGTEYQFRTEASWPTDPFMYLLNWQNREVDNNDDSVPGSDLNSEITYAPPPGAAGTHYVVVRSYSTGSAGAGPVRWRSRPTGTSTWGSWSDLSSNAWFGGEIINVEADQDEYRTVLRPTMPDVASVRGTMDTVVYGISTNLWLSTVVAFNDDGDIGWLSQLHKPTASYIDKLLVGAYSVDGTTDVLANDLTGDTDGDGVGPGLETEAGLCDSSASCPFFINPRDSDHDGLSDADELFGAPYALNRDFAVHLPAWGANPRKKDIFIEQDYGTSLSSNPFTESDAVAMQAKFLSATEGEIKNLWGAGDGIALHFDVAANGDPCPSNRTLCGGWGAGGERTNTDAVHPSRTLHFRHFRLENGYGGKGGVPANHWFSGTDRLVFTAVHELGHTLGLTHSGHSSWDSSGTAFSDVVDGKPHYASLMNYAYNSWTPEEFSHGANTAVVDPANLAELSTYAFTTPADAGRLLYTASPGTSHKFWVTDTMNGTVDWNRDGYLGEAGAIRGTLPNATMGGYTHSLASVEVAPAANVGAATPDLAAYFPASRLYAFYANAVGDRISYRAAEHNGRSATGGCIVGGGRARSECHAVSDEFAGPAANGGVITAVAALQWQGAMVVVWRTSENKVWLNRAASWCSTATCDAGATRLGELREWLASPVLVADGDANSSDVELTPMYVSTTVSGGIYPASHPPSTDSELLAVFYTSNSTGSGEHKFRYQTDPTSATARFTAWSGARSVTVSGSPLSGDVAPGVTVWPARTNATDNNLRALGYACGYFPRIPVTAEGTRNVEMYCYDKGADAWSLLNGISSSASADRKPYVAFHALRYADGSVIDDRKGLFWVGDVRVDGARIRISDEVSEARPPLGGGRGLRFSDPLEKTTKTFLNTGVAVYADHDISALKALGLYYYGDPAEIRHLTLLGLFDGSFHAELKDGNDFHVMEQGICRGLHDNTWCGAQGYWGYAFP